jgi:hypothetical protein
MRQGARYRVGQRCDVQTARCTGVEEAVISGSKEYPQNSSLLQARPEVGAAVSVTRNSACSSLSARPSLRSAAQHGQVPIYIDNRRK